MVLTISLIIFLILLLITIVSFVITFRYPNSKIGRWLSEELDENLQLK